MDIVCDKCGEQSAPASVWSSGSRVALECSACGHLNRVEAPPREAEPPVASEADTDQSNKSQSNKSLSNKSLESEPVDPEPSPLPVVAAEPAVGDVPPRQCQKCGQRYPDDAESCARCGFVFSHNRPGEMPWDEMENWPDAAEARELWVEAIAKGTEAAHDALVQFCIENELDDLAGRWYRFRAADRPDDHHATVQLEKMVERGRVRLLTRMEGEQSSGQSKATQIRQRILIAVFVIGLALALLLFWLYPNFLS